MAQQDHVDRFGSAAHWNQWRKDNPSIQPDLSGADLVGRSMIPLLNMNLSKANLRETKWFPMAVLVGGDFRGADLSGANLQGVNLTGVNLTKAFLDGTDLRGTVLSHAILGRTSFHRAIMGLTVLTGIDLSRALSLETVQHVAPSSIGLDTIVLSRGQIPESFLHDVGVAQDLIDLIRQCTAQRFLVDRLGVAVLTNGERKRSICHLEELETYYEALCKKINALYTDLARETDSEHRVTLNERLEDRLREREKVQEKMARIERQLG